MALDVETKAHNDKPFYAVAVRLGVTSAGQNGTAYLKALSAFLSVFQIGGRPFLSVTENEYRKLSQKEITDMLIMGTTYRTGSWPTQRSWPDSFTSLKQGSWNTGNHPFSSLKPCRSGTRTFVPAHP